MEEQVRLSAGGGTSLSRRQLKSRAPLYADIDDEDRQSMRTDDDGYT